ncbi:MAG: DEAD/DEAH box helicase family protein [Candidatus Thorarchaeota archaeon]|jgi:Fanconi anemia group M protein
MEQIKKFLKNINPRDYQKAIYETCKKKNCLVVLPTGTGKTLIALLLTIHRLCKFPDEKVVFMAPTRPLAEQHLDYFKKHLPELFATMELFTGKTPSSKRKKLWQSAEIIFSTPQCINNDVRKNLYSLNDVALLIVDECHRSLKNYAYTHVAKKYTTQSRNPRILGLTASPGHEKKKIRLICDNLDIDAVEIRTRQSDDVKQYLQELKFNTIKVQFPPEFLEIKTLLKKMYDLKVEELKRRKLLFGPANKRTLLETQHKIMRALSSGNKNFNLLLGASACAQTIKLQHAIELLETQTLSSFENYLENLKDQARLEKSKAVQRIVKQPEFNLAYLKTRRLITKEEEHPKLVKLTKLVEEEISKDPRIKMIVFAQFRDTVTKISKELNKIPEVNARVFVGQAIKKGKEKTGLSQKEQKAVIHEFSLGKINILCSTSIGEEGLDIPEVNAVVFYEPIPSAIRQIQRRGRTARLQKGKLVVLITKGTRDEAYHWAAFHKEKKMHRILDNLKDEMENNINTDTQKRL